MTMRMRRRGAAMEMAQREIDSLPKAPDGQPYVASFEGRQESTLRGPVLPMLDRQKGDGEIQRAAQAMCMLDV